MRPEEVSVGMRVRVRQWDDMDAESMEKFGGSGLRYYVYDPGRLFAGSNKEKFVFLEAMRKLCGEEFTIERIAADSSIIPSDFVSDNGVRLDDYEIEPWMLEPADPQIPEDLPDPSPDSLSEYMKGWCRS